MQRPKPSAPAWQPGQSGNPAGRPIGNRNKLNEKFILALHDDFVEHGAKVIEQVRKPETKGGDHLCANAYVPVIVTPVIPTNRTTLRG